MSESIVVIADKLAHELRHLVRLLEPLERDGGLAVPGLATLNGARKALKQYDEACPTLVGCGCDPASPTEGCTLYHTTPEMEHLRAVTRDTSSSASKRRLR